MTDEFAAALDPTESRRAFDRAAAGFDAAAVLHTTVRDSLLQRLELTTLDPTRVLDAGAGTGHGARALQRRYPKAFVIALDTSPAMLRIAARRRSFFKSFARVQGDAHRLPLADAAVELIVSNLMLHWCEPDRVFAEFRRVLAPRGLLAFTTFGPDTLRELRASWAAADSRAHVHPFIDMHDIGDGLVRAGFASPVLDVERFTLTYTDVRRVAADLKATGAHNALRDRARGLTGRNKFGVMRSAYERFRLDGRLPATYEVVYAHAWAPQSVAKQDGSIVTLESLKRQLRTRGGQ